MPLRRFIKANYFVVLIILLGIIALLVLAAFFLASSFPGILASPPLHFETREIYDFEPWHFSLGDLKVSYPEGGIIVPLYVEDKQKAVLFLGSGQYYLPDGSLPIQNPSGLFASMPEEALEEKRGDIIFLPVDSPDSRNQIHEVLARQLALPVLWEGGIPLTFQHSPEAIYYYFLNEDKSPLLPPVLLDKASRPLLATLLYLLFFATILTVLIILSPDHHFSPFWKQMLQARPRSTAVLAILPALFLALGGELLPLIGTAPPAAATAGYWAAALMLALLARSGQIDFWDCGLRRESLRHGYLMVLTAAVMLMATTIGMPDRVLFRGWTTVSDFVLILVLAGFAREAIWRGYIQTTLSRRFGVTAGLMLTVLLATAAHLVLLAITAPWKLAYPYTLVEAAALVPGLALVLGFLYLRTENLLACALLHTLVLYLPRVLVS